MPTPRTRATRLGGGEEVAAIAEGAPSGLGYIERIDYQGQNINS